MFDKSQPLWLPRGSIRAIITLLIVCAALVMAYIGKVNESILAILGVVINDYFGQRKVTDRAEADRLDKAEEKRDVECAKE